MAASRLREVGAHVVTTEQLVGHRAPAVEQLVGQLASQHQPVGHALARLGFGQRVEAADTFGREQEQRALLGTVDHERVTAGRARGGQRRHRIGELAVPRQRGVGDRWCGSIVGDALGPTAGRYAATDLHADRVARRHRLSLRTTPNRSPCSAKSTATSVGPRPRCRAAAIEACSQDRRVDAPRGERFCGRDPVVELEDGRTVGAAVGAARRRGPEVAGPAEGERRLLHQGGECVGERGAAVAVLQRHLQRMPGREHVAQRRQRRRVRDREELRLQPRVTQDRGDAINWRVVFDHHHDHLVGMPVEEAAQRAHLVDHRHRAELAEHVAEVHLVRGARGRRAEALVETRGRGHERGRELGGVAQRPREIRVHTRAARRAEVRVDLEAANAVLELGREGPPLVRRPEPVGRRRHRVVGGRERHRTEAAPAQAGRAVAPSRGRRACVGREGRQQGDEDEDED